MRLAAKGGGLEGSGQDGGDKVDLGNSGGGGGGVIEEGGELVQLRGGGELGRELRLRETFLTELSRWDSQRTGAIFLFHLVIRFQTAHSYKRARYFFQFANFA